MADLSVGILKREEIAQYIIKNDIIDLDVKGISKNDYESIVENVMKHGTDDAIEQLKKSPVGKRAILAQDDHGSDKFVSWDS